MKRKTTEDFIKDAEKVHGDRYDYNKVNYINCKTKVEIICSKHGVFKQAPTPHIKNKQGCPRCAGNKKKTTEEFVKEAKNTHKNKYNYSKTKYINVHTKVKIICPKHGEFYQTPKNHLSLHGCSKCAGNKKKTTEEFIKDAIKVHGKKYDYSDVIYKRENKKVKIICPKHGEFYQIPNGHLSGKGCLKCGVINKNTKEFIKDAKKTHGDRYNYNKVNYINCKTKVIIICYKHGEFKQSPNNHINGNNCPKCNKTNISNISQKWLDMCGVPLNCREIIIKCGRKKYIVDGYIKKTNTIYEFWGDYWHGNPEIFNPKEININRKKTFGELYKETINKKKNLKLAGYNIIDIWENKFKNETKIG